MILPGVSAPRRRSRFSLVYLVCRGARHKSGSGWTPNRAPTVREGLRHTHLLPAGGNPSLTVGAQIGVLPTLGFSRLAGIWPNPSHQCRAPRAYRHCNWRLVWDDNWIWIRRLPICLEESGFSAHPSNLTSTWLARLAKGCRQRQPFNWLKRFEATMSKWKGSGQNLGNVGMLGPFWTGSILKYE